MLQSKSLALALAVPVLLGARTVWPTIGTGGATIVAVSGIVDLVLANNQFDARAPEPWTARPVQLRWPPQLRLVNWHSGDFRLTAAETLADGRRERG
jgi:hypothetical protein